MEQLEDPLSTSPRLQWLLRITLKAESDDWFHTDTQADQLAMLIRTPSSRLLRQDLGIQNAHVIWQLDDAEAECTLKRRHVVLFDCLTEHNDWA